MNIAILGNSGSGKSTLARWLSKRYGAPHLDLDTVYWEPGEQPRPRSADLVAAEVDAFCREHDAWIVEGCYADAIATALRYQPYLIFMNPGEERCIAHCLSRPWEPHKFASPQQQQERLSPLLSWVRGYYTRVGEMSLYGHQACLAQYEGPKCEVSKEIALPLLRIDTAWHHADATEENMTRALQDTLADLLAGRFVIETAEEHLQRIRHGREDS